MEYFMESETSGRQIEAGDEEFYKYNAVVSKVAKNSIAFEAGIKKGDRVISINDHVLTDLIEYNYQSPDCNLKVLVERGRAELIEFDIEKDYGEDLGIGFEDVVFDKITRCANNCIFCFMDQMPAGLRKSLYLKDEDYRLSFLYGNFVTMTKMEEQDFERIKSLYLSPLYISVHTTNQKLRKQILRSHKAENIMKQLEELTSGGISIHTQVVVMPGVNDGEELVKTIEDLSYFYPQLESIGIVPVGLTKFREELTPLKCFTPKEAANVINLVKPFQNKFRRRFDKGLVYIADEFYLMAGVNFPEGDEYDEYPQFENGIGIVRSFMDDYHAAKSRIPNKLKYPKEFTFVTGVHGEAAIKNVIHDLNNRVSGLKINLATVENEFFGKSVTVTGLLTGRDIIGHFQKNPRDIPDHPVVIPRIMLNEESFLDDVTIDDMASELGCQIEVAGNDFEGILELITK